jgi:hypothetical protein
LTNINTLRMLSKYYGVHTLRLHSKVSTTEVQRFLEMVKTTIEELHLEEVAIDLAKLFHELRLPTLRTLNFVRSEKYVEELDVKGITLGCFNIIHLNISGIASFTIPLASILLTGL